MAVCEAVVSLLHSTYRPDDFNSELEFKVFTSNDFKSNTISNGASLFLYRIYCNGVRRHPAGRIGQDGKRHNTQLPLELHFLITVWGKEASLQNTLAGWIMRTLEDTPLLPSGILNIAHPGVFEPKETVDVSLAELRTEDMFRIWDVLGANAYQLSIPYAARVINIESSQYLEADQENIQCRTIKTFQYDSHKQT